MLGHNDPSRCVELLLLLFKLWQTFCKLYIPVSEEVLNRHFGNLFLSRRLEVFNFDLK
jgi:hypothetical protein